MKIQSLAVILAIILLPIIITLSYYIHREVDTIAMQTAYDTKLIDATHDAMASFELNTANEDLSSVADALRSIVEAANNTFFNSLATNLGMSNANKDYVRQYIPAILYTLYDGYYIYAPTRIPEVLVGKDNSGSEKLVYIGDKGITYKGSNSKGIGIYEFNEEDFKALDDESESAKSARQGALYESISNKYEYGQILYKNNNGTYSPKLIDNSSSEENTKYKQDYILKTYMPYSARYKGLKGSIDYDLTINYTLDNYITVIGNTGKVFYSKTGYLIGKDVVKEVFCQDVSNLLDYNEIDAEDICLSGAHEISLKIEPYMEDGKSRAETIEYNYSPYEFDGKALSYKEQKELLNKYYEQIENCYNEYRMGDNSKAEEIKALNGAAQELEVSLESLSAISYYVKSQIFSNWIYNNLGNGEDGLGLCIQEKDIKDDLALNNINYTTELSSDSNISNFHYSFSDSTKIIFDVNQDPEWGESNFVNHKYNVIRNSIQYNINLALSSYNKMTDEIDIKMPIMSENEWQNILQNISVVSFMQGINCGLKYYNNYAIVSSTNNEITVIPNEIYYVKKDEYNSGDFSDTSAIYHRIDCDELENTDELISFRSKEVKYDKIYDKNIGTYKYDHKNFACYNCIVNSNYLKRLNSIDEAKEIIGYNNNILVSSLSAERKKAYYRALAKARENIYKTNALTDSNGYEIIMDTESTLDFSEDNCILYVNSERKLKDIKSIEITFKDVTSVEPEDSVLDFTIAINDWPALDNFTLNLQKAPQTISLPIHEDSNSKISKININSTNNSIGAKISCLNIKVIYE